MRSLLEMSTAKDLVEEAKKRIVLVLVCIFGLSYLMSCECCFFENLNMFALVGDFIILGLISLFLVYF